MVQATKEWTKGMFQTFYDKLSSKKSLLTQTLSAGDTTVTFTNIPQDDQSKVYTYELYTNKPNLNYNSSSASVPGQISYTFDVQSTDITVYLVINEINLS